MHSTIYGAIEKQWIFLSLQNYWQIIFSLCVFFWPLLATYYLEKDYNIITLRTSLNCATICNSMSALNVLNLLKG
jgi:hypothetical protein